jgi:hypothetical protein
VGWAASAVDAHSASAAAATATLDPRTCGAFTQFPPMQMFTSPACAGSQA